MTIGTVDIAAEPNPALTEQAQRYIDNLKSDFVFFVEEVWKDRGLDAVAPLGDIERDICRFADSGPSRRGILAPRKIGKTHLVTITLALYRVFCDADHKVLIVSKSDEEAKSTLSVIGAWLKQVHFLKHLVPRKGQKKNKSRIEVSIAKSGARQPTFGAIGVDGVLEGNRAHTIIADDVETDRNTITLYQRNSLDARVREFASILYPDRPGKKSEIVYVGTFHHEDSLYLRLARRGYAMRSWPLCYPTHAQRSYILGLSPLIAQRIEAGAQPGEPILPSRLGTEHVAGMRQEGDRHFNMQHMLMFSGWSDSATPLSLKDFIVFSCPREKAPIHISYGTISNHVSTALEDIPLADPDGDCFYGPMFVSPPQEWAKYTGTKMFVDPAGKGADKVGVAVVSHLAGMLWIRYVDGLRGGYGPENLHRLSDIALRHNVNQMYLEDNFGGGMFQALLQPVLSRYFTEPGQSPDLPNGWKCSIESCFNTINKSERIINALEIPLSSHRLVLDPSIAANKDLQYQIANISVSNELPHQDEADALAGCIRQWQHVLSMDPKIAAEHAKEMWLESAIKESEMMMEMRARAAEPNWAPVEAA